MGNDRITLTNGAAPDAPAVVRSTRAPGLPVEAGICSMTTASSGAKRPGSRKGRLWRNGLPLRLVERIPEREKTSELCKGGGPSREPSPLGCRVT